MLRDPDKRARYDRDGSVDDGPAAGPSRAMEMLIQAFRDALANTDDLGRSDLIGATRRRLDKRADELMSTIALGTKSRTKLAAALTRLSRKGKGDDVLTHFITRELAQVDSALAELERERECCRDAHQLAAAYSWQVDPGAAGSAGPRPFASGGYVDIEEISLADMLRGARPDPYGFRSFRP